MFLHCLYTSPNYIVDLKTEFVKRGCLLHKRGKKTLKLYLGEESLCKHQYM